MAKLSADQQALKDSIKKSALIWGIILGLIAAGIAYWALGGQGQAMRMGGAAAAGAVVLGLIFSWRMKANSAAAVCGKCNTSFSIKRTDHTEIVALTEPKETRDAQPDYSTKVVKWVEDTVAVTDTYTCAKCGDTTVKKYNKTVKRDESEVIEPAPEKGKPADVKNEESWFSEDTSGAGAAKKTDGGIQTSPVEGVANSQKGKASGKASDKK